MKTKNKKRPTARADIEMMKAFILDTITSLPCSRTDVLVGIARGEHIDGEVFRCIGEFFRDMSGPALDFIACRPDKVQREILLVMKEKAVGVHAAILEITGEVLSDDAVYAADLLSAWQRASVPARDMFLQNIGIKK